MSRGHSNFAFEETPLPFPVPFGSLWIEPGLAAPPPAPAIDRLSQLPARRLFALRMVWALMFWAALIVPTTSGRLLNQLAVQELLPAAQATARATARMTAQAIVGAASTCDELSDLLALVAADALDNP
jgi:hypothetical protein